MSRLKVAVAMSGGVDSSVAAAILVDAGHDVIGVTMRLWREDGPCEADSEDSAKQTAAHLGIPHAVVDLRDEFRRCVVDQFVSEYAQGRTPNPCVRCNADIKFGALLRYAHEELCADKLATGHYVRSMWDDEARRWRLLRGVDRSKDQSYFLYRLTQGQLGDVLFPLGEMTKAQTRRTAARKGIKARERPESQDVCFISEGGYGDFLARLSPDLMKPGPIVDTSHRSLGEHKGIAFYTIGQRRGLGVAARQRLYVVRIEPESNTVVLGTAADLAKRNVLIDQVVLMSGGELTDSIVVSAKIRYNAQDSTAVLSPVSGNRAEIVFDQPQNAVTPGQSAVFYVGEEVLGGGVIIDDCAAEDGSRPRRG